MGTHRQRELEYRRPRELAEGPRRRVPVVIAGGGPIGLGMALDLSFQGIETILLEQGDRLSVGSKAICWAKRSLEILDRLGCARPIVERGITWNVGKVFVRDRLAYEFDLLPEPGHAFPAFVNLQQYYVEEIFVDALEASPLVDLRCRSALVGIEQIPDGIVVQVETPDGAYALEADYLIAADGCQSDARRLLGLEFPGERFEDRFLIADVVMKADFPTERWFWFLPPFHTGQSALLHRQADDVWRIDLQLGREADPDVERAPERVRPRVQAMLGPDRPFDLEWVSVYTFQCRRLERFVHDRVIFAGDAAPTVSPFGARGGNGGLQDVDNLAWKLAWVLRGLAPRRLLESYDAERIPAADTDIRSSTRATDFITPKDEASRTFRDAVLALAPDHPFARRLVNSGRLSVPAVLDGSPLSTADRDSFPETLRPGAPAFDAPVVGDGGRWLLPRIGGRSFTGLVFTEADGTLDPAVERGLVTLAKGPVPFRHVVVAPGDVQASGRLGDVTGLASQRHAAEPGTFYLYRPDQHVAARWRQFDEPAVRAALARATAREEPRDVAG